MTTYIDSLKLHPEFINTLREKYWSEWQDSLMREFNIKEFADYKLDPTGDYYILYKYENNKKIIMGTIALVDCDLHSHPNIKNWISYVYVFPEFRSQGVSTKLLDFIINKYNDKFTLTLWCKHSLKGLYEKNGFIITETLPTIYIMQKPKV